MLLNDRGPILLPDLFLGNLIDLIEPEVLRESSSKIFKEFTQGQEEKKLDREGVEALFSEVIGLYSWSGASFDLTIRDVKAASTALQLGFSDSLRFDEEEVSCMYMYEISFE